MRPCLSLLVTGSILTLLLFGPVLGLEKEKAIPRRIPPEGIEISDADQTKLREAVDALTKRLEDARQTSHAAHLEPLLSDVQIFPKAVAYALALHEFYDPKEVGRAYELLEMANRRLDQLLAGSAPWATERGLVVRGFRSRIDDSAQPYGLVIPRLASGMEKPIVLV